MTVRQSSITSDSGKSTTFYCDTQEELEEQVRLHEAVCLNTADPNRMLVIDRYPDDVTHWRGLFCGALTEDKQFQCTSSFVIATRSRAARYTCECSVADMRIDEGCWPAQCLNCKADARMIKFRQESGLIVWAHKGSPMGEVIEEDG